MTNRSTFEAGAALAPVAAQLARGSLPLPDVAAAGQLREEDIGRLAAAGYRAVIDLRHPDEPRGFDEAEAVRAAGLQYVNLPVISGRVTPEDFGRFRALLRDSANRPAVVHCATANRVGAMLVPYLVLDAQRTPERAVAIAQQAGLRSQELADAALAYVAAEQAAGGNR